MRRRSVDRRKADLIDAHSTFSDAAIVVVTSQGMTIVEVGKPARPCGLNALQGHRTASHVSLKRSTRSWTMSSRDRRSRRRPIRGDGKATTKFANDNDKFTVVAGADGKLRQPQLVQLSKMLPSRNCVPS